VYEVEVLADDGNGLATPQLVRVTVLNRASVSGAVFVDTNGNGLYDADEMGIDDVTVELLDAGGAVIDTAVTSVGGYYQFEDYQVGVYQIRETQPTGVDDGAEHLGSLGGTILANDLMQVDLGRIDGSDYDFAEIGLAVSRGDVAGIGFWQNKHGQALICEGGSALANWLTANFPNVFGDTFVGAGGGDVAAFYKDQLFKQKGGKSAAGPAKVDAQFMAVALATYFTDADLAGTVAVKYGFNVTDTGLGARIVNVGDCGAAFGVADDSNRTVLQLLQAIDDMTDQGDDVSGFSFLYDRNGDGTIDKSEAILRTMANDILTDITSQGGL